MTLREAIEQLETHKESKLAEPTRESIDIAITTMKEIMQNVESTLQEDNSEQQSWKEAMMQHFTKVE